MPSGFESYNEATGQLQFSADYTSLSLSTSGTITTRAQNQAMGDQIYGGINSRFTISYIGTPTSAPIMCVAPSAESTLERYTSDGNGFYTWQFMSNLAVGAATPYWVFDNQPGSSLGYGLELYNPTTGAKTYQNNAKPLRVVGVPYFSNQSPNSTDFTYGSGRIYAVGYGGFIGDIASQYYYTDPWIGMLWEFQMSARSVRAIPNGVNVSRHTYHYGSIPADINADRPGNLLIVDVTNYGESVVTGSSYTATMTAQSGNTSAGTTTQDFVRAVTANGGTPTNYSWSVTPTSGGGSWSIVAGQGTSQATARVTGVSQGTNSQAIMSCTVSFSGTASTATASDALSFSNTASGGGGGSPTFDVAPGDYSGVGDYFQITASSAVTWTYTRSGSTARNTSSPSSGGSSTTFWTSQSDGLSGQRTFCTVTLTATWSGGSASWTIGLSSPGSGGPEA